MSIEGLQNAVAAAAVRSVQEGHSSPAAPHSDAVKVAAPTPSGDPSIPVRDVSASLEIINRALQDGRRNLSFSIDSATGKTIVRVVKPSTGEVLRQIPSDEVLAIAASITAGEPLTSIGVESSS